MEEIIYVYKNIVINILTNSIYKDNTCIVLPPKIAGSLPWAFLKCLLKADGEMVSYDYLDEESGIWPEDIGKKINHRSSFSTWASTFNSFIGFKLIENERNRGYYISVPFEKKRLVNSHESITSQTSQYELPLCLSKNMPTQTTTNDIIFRENELNRIKKLISNNNNKILIHGFGGIGKTSMLRLLFWELIDNYEHIGWIEYRSDCQKSILTDLEVFGDITEQEIRWSKILKTFYNNKSRKILFIDNVDSDNRYNQNPINDSSLHLVSSFPNTTIIISSRLNELPGFTSFELKPLGEDEDVSIQKALCAELFYTYYCKEELQKNTSSRNSINEVYELIEMVSYHTYMIEILAKGAKYCSDLKNYVSTIKKKGISFPTTIFQTEYDIAYTNVAEQIRKVFDLQSRTPKELKLLWDFAVLPNIILTIQEVKEWLGYEEKDWIILEKQGWLIYKNGLIMHPLVKEAFHLNMFDDKPPKGTLDFFISLLTNNCFLDKEEDVFCSLKKLDLIESIIERIDFQNNEIKADIYFYIGYNYFNKVKMLVNAENNLRKAYTIYKEISLKNKFIEEKIGKSLYWIGYVQSATYGEREYAIETLKNAIDIFENIPIKNNSTDYYLALCYDHLGYVLSDREELFALSESHLFKALDLWKHLESCDFQNLLSEIATTEDNIGLLYSKKNNTIKMAEYYLCDALIKRTSLYNLNSLHSDDLSWTHHNLGDLFAQDESRLFEAEHHYRKALELRIIENNRFPGTAENNIAWTSVRLCRLLIRLNRIDEAKDLFESIQSIIDGFDKNHMAFFAEEIFEQNQILVSFFSDSLLKFKDRIESDSNI